MSQPPAEYVVASDEFELKHLFLAIEATQLQETNLQLHLTELRKHVMQLTRAYEKLLQQKVQLTLELTRAQAQLARWESREGSHD